MAYQDILTRIKASLDSIYPPGEYTFQLSQLLELNPRTVHRKLAGETQFSIREISKIAKFHSLRLSEILDCKKSVYKHPMQLFTWDYTEPDKFEGGMKKIADIFTIASQCGDAYFLHTNNFIPCFTCYNNKKLFRFLVLKWYYYTHPVEAVKPYSEIPIPLILNEFQEKTLQSIKQIDTSRYLLHENFFRNTIPDLISFYNKGYISRDEYVELLDEFSSLLEIFKQICDTGYFVYEDKKVEIFFTDLWLPNSFSILKSKFINFSTINVHFWDSIASRNQETTYLFEQWFRFWLKSSTRISLCSEKQRIEYINKQYKAVSDAYDYLQTGIYTM